jgi:ATP-binding cassette subfamily B protein
MQSLLRLTLYIKRYAWTFWFSVLGMLVARIIEGSIPMFVQQGIDTIANGQSLTNALNQTEIDNLLDALVFPVTMICFCVLVQMVVTIAYRIGMRRIGVNASYDLRNRLYQHMQLQSLLFFSQYRIGDLMARAINDINLCREILAGAIRMTIILFMTAAVGIGYMLSYSVELTLAVMLPMPIITYVAFRFAKKIYAQSYLVQEGFASVSTFVQENLNGIRTIQSMAQEDREIEKFREVNSDFVDKNINLFITNSFLSALMPILAASGTLIIIGYGSQLLNQGAITIGTFAAFFSYLGLLLWPVREAGNLVTQWQRGASGTARLFEILDHEPEIEDSSTQDFPDLSGKISAKNLSYEYEGKEKLAINNLSFEVQPGETIAILGRVGSGKSTLLRLFVRLLDPTQGQIYLDGHPINGFPLASLREKVCLVLQDPFLFADSLGDNIAYDNPNRDPSEILEITKAAALDDTVEGFPEGLDTILGERGVTLSGGQKQRTALARGLIRQSPILILDDCFSAVDTETEERILQGLKQIRKNSTTLLVSHRVSTARHADRIMVLEHGEIKEIGTHQELLNLGGFYAGLELSQRNTGSSTPSRTLE